MRKEKHFFSYWATVGDFLSAFFQEHQHDCPSAHITISGNEICVEISYCELD